MIYLATPAKPEWVSVDNVLIAIEHPSKSPDFYLPIHAGNVLLKFGLEIQGQTKFRVQKQKTAQYHH